MSWKAFFLIILIFILGIFIFLKIQVLGSPTSNFNQTTRFAFGRYPIFRTILGLHSAGDARTEYLEGNGPITIDWFAPQEENIDQGTLQNFADLVNEYTGRPVKIMVGGVIDDGTIAISDLASYKLTAGTQSGFGSNLLVFFTEDYSPRPAREISGTYQESGIVLSLNAQRSFLQGYPQDLDQYLLSSMLNEFGNQIGMQETATGSPYCIMGINPGMDGRPLESFGYTEPQDFCQSEKDEVNNIKLQLEQ